MTKLKLRSAERPNDQTMTFQMHDGDCLGSHCHVGLHELSTHRTGREKRHNAHGATSPLAPERSKTNVRPRLNKSTYSFRKCPGEERPFAVYTSRRQLAFHWDPGVVTVVWMVVIKQVAQRSQVPSLGVADEQNEWIKYLSCRRKGLLEIPYVHRYSQVYTYIRVGQALLVDTGNELWLTRADELSFALLCAMRDRSGEKYMCFWQSEAKKARSLPSCCLS